MDFQFKKENFYHLLGFHKLTDVTVVRMVETHQMKRETFFEYVLSGRIGLDKTDKNIVDSDIIVNICDTKKKSDLGEIKANRFAVFSEKNILELLLSDPVIDFEDSDCDTLIDADKIFFKLHTYLFFIRREKTCDLPVTREKTVAETSFLCGFRGRGESSNPLTHVI